MNIYIYIHTYIESQTNGPCGIPDSRPSDGNRPQTRHHGNSRHETLVYLPDRLPAGLLLVPILSAPHLP